MAQKPESLIIYIHGVNSIGLSTRSQIIQSNFKNVFSPSLPLNYKLAVESLESAINIFKKHYTITLIGFSLGGYYSIYLANKYNLKAVLINPAVNPYETIRDKQGQNIDQSGVKYYITEESIELLKQFEVINIDNPSNFMLLVTTGDECLNYQDALKKLPDSPQVVVEGGNHSFQELEKHIDKIKQFIGE